MATVYAIVNTDLMSGTDDRSRMRSFRYGKEEGGKFVPQDIQNGSVVTLTDALDRDLYKAVDPKTTTPLKDLVLVATPELMYDERKKNMNEFYNEAGSNSTGFVLKEGDIFSVTAEALEGTPAVGSTVGVGTGTMIKVGGTGIGKIIDKWIHNKDTYYGIKVG